MFPDARGGARAAVPPDRRLCRGARPPERHRLRRPGTVPAPRDVRRRGRFPSPAIDGGCLSQFAAAATRPGGGGAGATARVAAPLAARGVAPPDAAELGADRAGRGGRASGSVGALLSRGALTREG